MSLIRRRSWRFHLNASKYSHCNLRVFIPLVWSHVYECADLSYRKVFHRETTRNSTESFKRKRCGVWCVELPKLLFEQFSDTLKLNNISGQWIRTDWQITRNFMQQLRVATEASADEHETSRKVKTCFSLRSIRNWRSGSTSAAIEAFHFHSWFLEIAIANRWIVYCLLGRVKLSFLSLHRQYCHHINFLIACTTNECGRMKFPASKDEKKKLRLELPSMKQSMKKQTKSELISLMIHKSFVL